MHPDLIFFTYLGFDSVCTICGKILEQCFAITLTNHSVQAQILHFTNAQPRFRPDWALSGACIAWYPAWRKSTWYTVLRFQLIKKGVAYIYDVCTI